MSGHVMSNVTRHVIIGEGNNVDEGWSNILSYFLDIVNGHIFNMLTINTHTQSES